MIEIAFDYALHALSGITESLHAAGVEVCLPTYDDIAKSVECEDAKCQAPDHSRHSN